MSLDDLRKLTIEAQQFGPTFPQRLARRNALLAELYDREPGLPWQRLSRMADAVIAVRPIWRRDPYSTRYPTGLTALQIGMLDAARLVGKLPPTTARGLHAALKNTKSQISTAHDDTLCSDAPVSVVDAAVPG